MDRVLKCPGNPEKIAADYSNVFLAYYHGTGTNEYTDGYLFAVVGTERTSLAGFGRNHERGALRKFVKDGGLFATPDGEFKNLRESLPCVD